MIIPESSWVRYIDMLAAVNETAARKFTAWLNTHEIGTAEGRKAAIDYAAALTEKYGESAAAAACEMYDAVAAASGASVPAAVPAAPASYGDVAKTVNGMLKQNKGNEAIGAGIGKLVKRTGVDTTMQNAIRDRTEWAWVPNGDTCAFCMILASRGWQKASKNALKNGHAEHIHPNCDCTYAVRFDKNTSYASYDPDEYREIYDNAEGDTWQEKRNSIRREHDAAHREEINARKRELYAQNKEKNNQPVVTDIPKKPKEPTYGHRDVTNEWLKNAVPNSHPVRDIESFVQDGVTYNVDGNNVKYIYSDHERDVANLLRREFGGDIIMMPKVEKPERVQTPDYLFRGQRFDLKTPEKINRNTIFNAVHDKREQADNFIIDLSINRMSIEEAEEQTQRLFNNPYATFVQNLILVQDNEILRVFSRNK